MKWLCFTNPGRRLSVSTFAVQPCGPQQPRYCVPNDNIFSHAAAKIRMLRSTTMIEADTLTLSSIPWAAKLINNKRWTPTLSHNRVAKPTGEDSFFAETLDTGRTIRTMLMLKPTQKKEGDFPYEQLLVILDLGDGLNGYPQVLHGGFATTLLDETCGALIQLNVFEKVRKLGSQHAMNYLTACRYTCTCSL